MHVVSRTGRPEGVTLYGQRILERRRALGLTQSALADLAKLSVRTVRTAEQGEPVSADTARCLGATLHMAYVEIVRPSPEVIRRQLESRGLAPVRLREPFRPIEAADSLASALDSTLGGVTCVDGPKGVGKATLIRHHLASEASTYRDGILWVTVSRLHDRAMLERVLVEIADCLGFGVRLPDPRLVAPEAFDVAFCRRLWSGDRLLVLADLEDPALLRPFTAEGTPRILVTTSRRWVAEAVADQRIQVQPWDDAAILALLEQRAGRTLDVDTPSTRQLLELIGGLPLYANLVATALQSRRYRTAADLLARVERALDGNTTVRDPVIRSLVTTVQEDLEPTAREVLADLGLAATTPFSVTFAADVLGCAPEEARHTLDDLADTYLVQPLDASDALQPRYRLAEWALGSLHRPSRAAIERYLAATTARWREPAPSPQTRYARLLDERSLLVTVLDRVLACSELRFEPARSPDDLPTLPAASGLDSLPALLVALGSLIRYAPPATAGTWLTAALAVVDDQGPRAALGWMLGWWWMRAQDRPDTAYTWATWARQQTVDPDTRTSLALHGGILARRAHGLRGEPRPWAEARTLARQPHTTEAQRACAFLHAAVSGAFRDEDVEEAIAACDAAFDLAGAIDDVRGPILAGAATLNAACFRLLAGVPVPPEAAAPITGLAATLRPDPTLLAGIAELAHHARLDVELPALDPSAHYLALAPADAEAALAHLSTVAAQLGCQGTGLVRDARVHGSLELASFDISGWPLSSPPGIAFPMVLPLGGIRRLLLAEKASLLHFVGVHRSDAHPLVHALDALTQ